MFGDSKVAGKKMGKYAHMYSEKKEETDSISSAFIIFAIVSVLGAGNKERLFETHVRFPSEYFIWTLGLVLKLFCTRVIKF